LFGARGGRGAFGGGAGRFDQEDFAAEKGRDLEGDILVTLDEAMKGSVRSVSVRRGAPCDRCGGTGERAGHLCNACGGTGQIQKTETYQVKIPAGVTEGQRLRVAGRGEAGLGGGAAGDLFLRVKMAKHPDFTLEDHNLIFEAEIAPWEAVLGAEISVPTLDGRVNIRIPAGTQNGQKLRVRGRGLPKRNGEKGDIIVQAQIEVPEKINETERKLWQQLAKESAFNPRQ
jgi:curved DNA-binding protein